jgi:tetratricopeptide (TPR) repeat protein
MVFLRNLFLLLATVLLIAPVGAAEPSKKDINDCGSMDEQTAIKGCTALIKKSPKNPRAQMAGYLNRGLAHQRLRENDKAMADFDQGIKLVPENTLGDEVAYNLYLNRGRLKYELKDYKGSAADSEAATKIDATKPDAFTNWAYALLELDEFELAGKQVWWANAVRPDHPPTLALSGIVSFYLGKYDQAMEHTERALELQRDLTWALANRALFHWWKGDLDRAMADLDGVLAAWPSHSWAHALKARIHVTRNELAEARQAVDRAIAADPNLARAVFTKGLVDAAEGKADEARAAFEKTMELDATLTEALTQIGKLSENAKDYPKALEWYDRMIAAPVKSDQDKVRREQTIADRERVVAAIERPAKLAKACLEAAKEEALPACKETLDQTSEPQKRLPFLLARLKADATLADADEVIAIEPRNYEARMARGSLLLGGNQRRPDDALKDFAVAQEIEPKRPEPLIAAAEAYLHRGDQTKSMANLDAALALAPNDRTALAKKTWLHMERKELKEAKAAAERLTLNHPDDVFGWTAAATTLEAIGDDAGAEKAATRAITLNPDFGEPKLVRGGVLFRRGDMAGAANELSRALTGGLMTDQRPAAHRMRARAFLALGNGAGALEDAESLIGYDPKDVDARALRASANMMRGDTARALADSAEVLKTDPKNVEMHLLRIAARANAGDHAQAEKDADAAMKAVPGDARFIAARGEALLAQGKTKEALADIDAARKLAPADAKLALLGARANMDLGQADAALASLGAASASAEALTVKGEALLAKRQLPQALEALEAAVKLDGGNIRALKLSGDLYAQLGTNDLALQHYGKAIDRKPKSDTDRKLLEAARKARAELIEKLANKTAQ